MTTKKTITLFIAVLYGLLSLLLFSETFITQLLEAKKNYYLTVSKNFTKLHFTTKAWAELDDKKEFKLNNNYYDVKKIELRKNKVTVTVIKDEYENVIKYISKHIYPKNKKGKTLKNKKTLAVFYTQTISEENSTITERIQHNYSPSYLHSKLHVKTIFHPPCT